MGEAAPGVYRGRHTTPRIREAFKPKRDLPSLESRVSLSSMPSLSCACIYSASARWSRKQELAIEGFDAAREQLSRFPARALLPCMLQALATTAPLILVSSSVEGSPDPRRTTARATRRLCALLWRYANPPTYIPGHDHAGCRGARLGARTVAGKSELQARTRAIMLVQKDHSPMGDKI